MITEKTVKWMNLLPEKLVLFLSKKIVNHYLRKYATLHIKGKANLKNIETPTIFVCNHLSNSDGLVLDKALKEIDPTFVAGVKLSDDLVTQIGVNVIKTTNIKPNSVDREGLKKIFQLIKQKESLLLFPEGMRSRTGSLIEAKKGILLIARMTGAPIVPIGLYGTEKLLPINQEGNMSGESFNHASVHIHIGQQIELPKRLKGQDKKSYEAANMRYIMESIAELLPQEYQGVYELNR